MPNWCNNTLTIRGKKEDLLAFKKELEDNKPKDGHVCLFQTFVPPPVEMKDTQSPNRDKKQESYFLEKYAATDWYNWQIINWGIKWGCCGAYWEEEDVTDTYHDGLFDMILHYDTPWGPGDDCLKEVFESKDNLSFFLLYEEPGMGFQGNLFVRNGKTENQECISYISNDIESIW